MNVSDYENVVLTHYSNSEVQNEITRFSQNRWIAVHCEVVNPQGYQVLLRYEKTSGKDKVPLTVAEPDEVLLLLNKFKRLHPRTFYASACAYKELSNPRHVKDFDNIMSCTPTWDIDNTPEKWRATIEAAASIIELLHEEDVSKSVFSKWSGKGMHVHVHQRAFSENLLQKITPLDAAYAIVEYINRTLELRFAKIAKKYSARELSAANEIDSQRVFTCPLSLHRSLDRVAVCVPPASLNDFTSDWTKPGGYQHWKDWNQFEIGEADSFAEKAYQSVGGYKRKTQPEADLKPRRNPLTKWIKEDLQP